MSVFHLGNLTEEQYEELANLILALPSEKASGVWHYLFKHAPDVVLRLQKYRVGAYIAEAIQSRPKPAPSEDALFFNKLYGWPLP
jgi:hypothetical protein